MAKKHNLGTEFYDLANAVTETRARNFGKPMTKLEEDNLQEFQVNHLLKLEHEFKQKMLQTGDWQEIYKKFVEMIVIKNRRVLSARPYFRERAVEFSKKVLPVLKSRNIDQLKQFSFNYKFIKFAIEVWPNGAPQPMTALFNDITDLRRQIIENSIPLAINRAKRFYRKGIHLTIDYMEMINACVRGLITGVDKWSGKYSKVFRSVCIGGMVGNLIEMASQTDIHFYPSDKKILYKINIIRFREGVVDPKNIAIRLNKDPALKGRDFTEQSVTYLINASNIFSADLSYDDDDDECNIFKNAVAENADPEELSIDCDTHKLMIHGLKSLPLQERKVLKMKGVEVPEMEDDINK